MQTWRINYCRIWENKKVNFVDTKCSHSCMPHSPDFLCRCDCCGQDCGEVKCPYFVNALILTAICKRNPFVWRKIVLCLVWKEIMIIIIRPNNKSALLAETTGKLLYMKAFDMMSSIIILGSKQDVWLTEKVRKINVVDCGVILLAFHS